MEQALGHVTHHQNLARWVDDDQAIRPTWIPIEPERADVWERLPIIRGNWSLKASLRARDGLSDALRKRQLDALFLHTQTVALFAVPFMQRIPSVISLDATPLNYDAVGAEYGHQAGNVSWLERRKYQWNRRTFEVAHTLVTWCQWAKDSLVADYGIAPDKIQVIPPGVDLARWDFQDERVDRTARASGPLRLLFVGGDFPRKGGEYVLEAFQSGLALDCELDIVTKNEEIAARLADNKNVRVHCGLTANSAPLRALFAQADVFVFPTLGDCLPIAVMEAMAAGLPVVTTDVGALREEVEDGVNGLIIPPRDPRAIVEAVQTLLHDEARRQAMGATGRRLAEAKFDACTNYNKILTLLKQIA